MRETSLVAFNLLLNAVGSFAIGVVLASIAARVLRGAPGRATVWLLSLPFAKIVIDAARGVPAESFLWLRARGVTQDLGSFRAGIGVERIVPKIDLSLGALSGGVTYSQSAADLLASGLLRYVGEWAPGAVAAVLVAGAGLRVARRLAEARSARAERLRVVAHAAREHRRAGGRAVPIHVVPGLEGSAFTGGVVRPYVAFPERLWLALSDDEREAAIQHELAHVAELHVPWTIAVGVVRDVFWFVPFIGRFHARLVASFETAADAIATTRGADPVALASALVRTRELSRDARAGRGWALAAAEGSLASRVAWLLRPASTAPRFAHGRVALRALFVAWAAAAVVVALPFGNH